MGLQAATLLLLLCNLLSSTLCEAGLKARMRKMAKNILHTHDITAIQVGISSMCLHSHWRRSWLYRLLCRRDTLAGKDVEILWRTPTPSYDGIVNSTYNIMLTVWFGRNWNFAAPRVTIHKASSLYVISILPLYCLILMYNIGYCLSFLLLIDYNFLTGIWWTRWRTMCEILC